MFTSQVRRSRAPFRAFEGGLMAEGDKVFAGSTAGEQEM